MNLDFRSLDIESRPTLILETLDFTPIAPIGDAYGLRADIKYNEVSEIEFTVPHFVDGHENEYFDEIQSMRVVEVSGLGRFRLVSPNITIDGLTEVKVCKGYSLEYELSQKILNLGNGTYNLWNPLKQDNTILGMFMKDFPAWRVMHEHDGVIGIDISASLVDRYRTFEVSDNFLNFFKSTAQQSYQCVFEFDPFERIIKVRAAKDDARQLPIMIAPENLAKEIQVEELSDEIYTCFDVNGADGVDIRSVNPTGTNKIYNLSYYMNEKNFSPELIAKYNEWNEKILSVRDSYYSYSIQRANAYLELEMAKAEYTALQGEYTTKENLYSVAAQAELSGVSGTDKSVYRAKMEEIRQKMLAKEKQIKGIQARIDTLQSTLDGVSNQLAFETYFADELVLLSPYIKESVMSESTFVATNTATYGETGALLTGNLFDITIKDSSVVDCTNAGSDNGILATDSTIKTYRADGGSVEIKCTTLNDDGTKTDVIINGSVQHAVYNIHTKDNRLIGSIVFQKSVTNDDGSTDDVTATLTVVRDDFSESMLNVKTTYDYESEDLEYDYTGYMNLIALTGATLYLTSESTEFQRSSVQWELYDYAWDLLEKSAYPSYSFTVDAANFLTLNDFVTFKNNFELGQRTYLQLREGYVLSPIVVGASFEYDNPESLTLEFANQFNSNSGEFGLLDLLEKPISIGNTVDTSKFGWGEWKDSKASTVIGDFMKSEIDYSLNRLKSKSGQQMEMNGSGLHLRQLKSSDYDGSKYDEIANASEYDPHQIWMSNDSILFTDDGWENCKMAIGKGSLGYGIIADYLVGKVIAGENLTITNNPDDKLSSFIINSEGITVNNNAFKIQFDDGKKDISDVISDLQTATTYRQDRPPMNPKDGDLWFNTGDPSDGEVIADPSNPFAIGNTIDVSKIVFETSAEFSSPYSETTIIEFENGASRLYISGSFVVQIPSPPNIEGYKEKRTRLFYEFVDEGGTTSSILLYENFQKTDYYDDSIVLEELEGWEASSVNDRNLRTITNINEAGINLIGGLRYFPYIAQKLYRYNAETSDWDLVQDGSIDSLENDVGSINGTLDKVISESGDTVKLSSVSGLIENTFTGMQGVTGNLYMDKTGLWLIDKTDPKSSSKAVWVNGAGIMIASSRSTEKSNSDCPSYNENNSSFNWSTAISASGVAANTFVGESIFGNIELGVGSDKGIFTASDESKWNFYVNKSGNLHANGADVRGDIYCNKLYVDEGKTDIKSLLKAIQNNVKDLGNQASLGLSNTNLDIQFERSGDSITHIGGGITFTDVTDDKNTKDAGSFGAVIAASKKTGLGLRTYEGYPIVIDSGGDMSLNTGAEYSIHIGQSSNSICIGNNNGSVKMISIGPSESSCSEETTGENAQGWVYINGKTMKDWLTEASGGGKAYYS